MTEVSIYARDADFEQRRRAPRGELIRCRLRVTPLAGDREAREPDRRLALPGGGVATSSRRGSRPKSSKRPGAPEAHLEHIEALIAQGGDITVGPIASMRCAATAADEHTCYAMLQRRTGETVVELLRRLDDAIARTWEEEAIIDEINPP